MSDRRVVHRVCPFCEATCGLVAAVEGDTIVSVRGDKQDPFSRGYICPKAYGLKELHHDPDRLRRPVRRTAQGWQEITWDEAYDEVASRLIAIREKYGNDAIGTYTGNPVVHDLGAVLYRPVLQRALASRSMFNASAIDTLPKIVQTGLMFGRHFPMAVPVPDIDRTQYLLIVGANPVVSHGSLMTMPDAPGRLKAVIERGGKVVVIDPRRTETAKIASEHHFIQPATDAAFLLAIVETLFEEDLIDLGAAAGLVGGLDTVRAVAAEFTPESVAMYCGIPAAVIRRIARELAAAESAACYGRLGTCVQEFGTLATWGCDLVNILTGNLDRPGGVMFTTPAAPIDAAFPKGKGFEVGRWKSRVSGQPEVEGMIPSSTMAEEMLTEGDGRVRAMFLLMTNPLRSAANSRQLEEAFSRLDFLVAVDFYVNETTRHAHIILPTPAPSEQASYEVGLYLLAVRNVAHRAARAGVAAVVAGAVEHQRATDGPDGCARASPRRLHSTPVRRRRGRRLHVARPDRRRDRRKGERGNRSGTHRRHALAHRTVRGWLRPPTHRSDARQGASGAARHRPRTPAAATARRHQYRERSHRTRAANDDRRRAAPAHTDGTAERRDDADRTARSPLQQLVHAQFARLGERPRPVHTAHLSARRRSAAAEQRRRRPHHQPRRKCRSARRGHRRSHARCRQPPTWVGTRRRGEPTAGGEGSPRRQHQRAHRQSSVRRRERHRRTFRYAGHGRAGDGAWRVDVEKHDLSSVLDLRQRAR